MSFKNVSRSQVQKINRKNHQEFAKFPLQSSVPQQSLLIIVYRDWFMYAAQPSLLLTFNQIDWRNYYPSPNDMRQICSQITINIFHLRYRLRLQWTRPIITQIGRFTVLRNFMPFSQILNVINFLDLILRVFVSTVIS